MGGCPAKASEGETADGQPHILIVGAGFGGLGCVHALGALGTPARVTVIDRNDTFTIGGTWQFVWTGRLGKEQTTWPLSSAVLPAMAELKLNATITKIDVTARKAVLADGSTITYDQLVLAPGSVVDGTGIPGLIDHALDLYSFDSIPLQTEQLEHFIHLARTKLSDSAGEKAVLLIPIGTVPYKCPVAPWEVAFLVDAALTSAGVREGARIVITAPNEWPLPKPTRPKFEAKMAEKGVEFLNNQQLTAMKRGEAQFADGTTVTFDLAWAVYPQRAPDFVRDSGLVNSKGYVPVDLQTSRMVGEAVKAADASSTSYCIGDCCWTMIQPEQPHPKAGEFAWHMGTDVAKQIDAACRGQAQPPPPTRKGVCFAEAGNGTALVVDANLSAVLADPTTGKPDVSVTNAPAPDGEKAKVAWVNHFLNLIFSGKVAPFSC